MCLEGINSREGDSLIQTERTRGFSGGCDAFADFCGMSRNEREEVETTFFPQIFICTVSRRHKKRMC